MSDFIMFRKARITDLNSLRELMILTFHHSYAHMNDPENFQLYMEETFAPEVIQEELQDPNNVYWLGLQKDEAVAFIKLNFEEKSNKFKEEKAVEIQRIYVHPKLQGQGIGAQLIQKAKQEAKYFHAKNIWLGVWKKNPAAIRFYKRHDFVEIGAHVFRLGKEDQEDLILGLSV